MSWRAWGYRKQDLPKYLQRCYCRKDNINKSIIDYGVVD